MNRKRHEIWALCVLTISLLVFFSLISYHTEDPRILSYSTADEPARNLVGTLGAHIAWPLFFLLGIGAYGLVFAGFWASWRLFRRNGFDRPWVRIGGIALLISSLITFFNLHWPRVPLAGGMDTGGKLAAALSHHLITGLGSVGSHILLLGAFLIALLMATPITLEIVYCGLWDLFLRIRAIGSHGNSGEEEDTSDETAQLPAADFTESPVSRKEKPAPELSPSPPNPVAIKKQGRKEPLKQLHLTDKVAGQYLLPGLGLLDVYETDIAKPDWKRLEQNAAAVEEKLSDFGVQGKVVGINPGPVITMFEYAPAPGIKISRVTGLAEDLSMALKAISIRVAGPVPGKAAIGIEIPNPKREMVSAKAVLESENFTASSYPLTIALGKDITGNSVATNLARMPHLLIAGATGTGKSVCINTILTSLLFRNTPEDLRLLLIDPKRIELKSFEDIPHLIHPVVTDAKMATRALRWAVEEMELRYKQLADKNVRNIETYNRVLAKEKQTPKDLEGIDGENFDHQRLPYIVIIIDELADLMMVATREVEESITRLAQMARAAGIHLILATQRPSVDVLTGIIKANIPTRISFQVSSRIDSRTILDSMGAESLLGSGDMLFLPPGTAKLQRIHGAFISDSEVSKLTEHWRKQKLEDDPLKDRVDFHDDSASSDISEEEIDEKYEEAVQLVLETRQASISMLQRRLRVGYNRAARMIELMEQQGIVTPSDGIRPREVLGRR